MISVESKLFSIYASGYVRAGKRETRVRIHAVVDFRNAPPPGAAQQLNQMSQLNRLLPGQNGAPPPGNLPPPQPGQPGATPNLNDPNTLLQAMLKPTPGGTIIHYKVE
jgi:hypothetical protein